jgi:hypothetical protein
VILDLCLLGGGADIFDCDRREVSGTDHHFDDREGGDAARFYKLVETAG